MVKNPPASVGVRDVGLIPGLERSPGGGHGKLLQYSCLENRQNRQKSLAGYSPQGHKELDMTEVTQPTCTVLYDLRLVESLYVELQEWRANCKVIHRFSMEGWYWPLYPNVQGSTVVQSPRCEYSACQSLNVSCQIGKPYKSLGYDPAIPLLGIYPEETQTEKDTCTPILTAALFTVARTWKQPRCPLTDDWIKKLWYIYTMEYYTQP